MCDLHRKIDHAEGWPPRLLAQTTELRGHKPLHKSMSLSIVGTLKTPPISIQSCSFLGPGSKHVHRRRSPRRVPSDDRFTSFPSKPRLVFDALFKVREWSLVIPCPLFRIMLIGRPTETSASLGYFKSIIRICTISDVRLVAPSVLDKKNCDRYSLFEMNTNDWNMNAASSYLDPSPLYGLGGLNNYGLGFPTDNAGQNQVRQRIHLQRTG
jgi:hypothetical protein